MDSEYEPTQHQVPTYVLEDDQYDLGPIYLHRWVDAQDEYHKWYEAQIAQLDISEDRDTFRVKVHYKGWKKKFDEWIDLNTDGERVRRLHTFTERPQTVKSERYPKRSVSLGVDINELKIGSCVDCLDSCDKWYSARVVDINQFLVKIRYDGWNEEYDEWINKSSYRLAPMHAITKPKTGGIHSVEETRRRTVIPAKVNEEYSSGMSSSSSHSMGNKVPRRRYPIQNSAHSNIGFPSIAPMDNHMHRKVKVEPMDVDIEYKKEPEDPRTENERYRNAYLSNFQPTADDERRFRLIMKRRGWELVDMGEDGNCLFRSLSHQLYGDERYHRTLRDKCVDYMEAESAFFRNFVSMDYDRYCSLLRRPGVWGGNLEIQVFSEMYKRRIEIYAYDEKPMKTFNEDNLKQSNLSCIRLSYHFNSHYNSIIDPLTHHRNILTSEPGVEEEKMIRYAKLRTSQAHRQSVRMSDLAATDSAQLANALALSRSLFEKQNDQSEMDKAIAASLKESQKREEIEIQKAIAASVGEDPSMVMQRATTDDSDTMLQQIEESEIEQAMRASLRETNTLPSCVTAVVDMGYPLDRVSLAYSIFEGGRNGLSDHQFIARIVEYLRQEDLQKQHGIYYT